MFLMSIAIDPMRMAKVYSMLHLFFHTASKCRDAWSAVWVALKFSVWMAVVFAPLGAIASWAVELMIGSNKAWTYLMAVSHMN